MAERVSRKTSSSKNTLFLSALNPSTSAELVRATIVEKQLQTCTFVYLGCVSINDVVYKTVECLTLPS